MPKERKSTAEEIERRVSLIAEVMIKGIRSPRRIILYVREQDRKAAVDSNTRESWGAPWNVHDDMIREYTRRAAQLFAMAERDNLDQERALQLERLENVYAAALRAGKHMAAIRALREINFLRGFGEVGVNVPGLERLVQALEAGAKRKPILPAMQQETVQAGVNGNGNGNGSHNGNGRNGHSTP